VQDATQRKSNPLSGGVITKLVKPHNGVRVTLQEGADMLPTNAPPHTATHTNAAMRTGSPELPTVGTWLWFRDGGRPNAGLITQYSFQITYTNVTFRFMSGFGVVAQYTRDITFNNVTIEPTKESGRGCACAADLLHFSGCAGQITVAGGRFVGSQDDAVNVHGTHMQIVSHPSPTSIVVQFMQPESYGFPAFFIGNRVRFTRADSLLGFGDVGIIKAASMQNAIDCVAQPGLLLPCQQLLEFEAVIPGKGDTPNTNTTLRLHSDVVENLEYAPDVNITGYGARFSTEVYTRGCHWFPRMFA
jgi:hypothetical protein